MKQELLTLAKQINAKELKFAKFKLMADGNKNEVTLMKGQKFLRIRYNAGSDLYDLQRGKIIKFKIKEEEIQKGFYSDMLRKEIEEYFKFEYVMDSIKIVGVNC